ncbi:MAG: peptidase M23 [Methylophaga sp.]|nr:MAG: peptidase M23 [Methylophaga sp.]
MLIRYFFTALLLYSNSAALWAAKEPAAEQQLKDVKTEIHTLSTNVANDKSSQSELFQQLKQQSHAVSALNRTLLELKQKIQQHAIELTKIEKRQQQEQHSHDFELTALNKQIRAAYNTSQPNFVKVLLNQKDPASFSRSSVYFHYFNQARQQQLIDINAILQNLTADQKALLAAQKKQQQLYNQQQQKQQALQQQTQQRQATLAALDKKIASQDARLALLKEQEQSLQSLLHSLNKPKASTSPTIHKAFAKRLGSLTWPVKGKVLARYGSSRKLGKLKWRGIMIGSPSGKDVVASAPGRVVFSDWLRGFGLLMIIDHGDQYMTLYGNNETLLKQEGDNVVSGELIAQSGDKGIRQYAGLYFELRHRGNPRNPLKWLGKKS